MNALDLVLACAVVLLALGTLFIAGASQRIFAREVMRIVAQADERVKAYMRNNDKVLDRWMAMNAPENYTAMRAQSGIIEGAQYSTKQHYLDEQKIAEEVDRRRKETEREDNVLKAQRAAIAQELAARQAQQAAVFPQTSIDFEPQNGASG